MTTACEPATPLSSAVIDAIRAQPGFRAVVEAYCDANLAGYHALDHMQRWMRSDMGRASLSGAVSVFCAQGRLTPAVLAGGEVSRGRARLYLQRAIANGLIVPLEPDAPLRGGSALMTTPRFDDAMTGLLKIALDAAVMLLPEVGPGLDRFDDPAFLRRVIAQLGRLTNTHSHLFPLARPIQLFQSRDGGMRILEELILRQAPGRPRLLDTCDYSHAGLARASCCSRAQVIELLRAGEAHGFLARNGRTLTISPVLSDDAEQSFAALFAAIRTAVLFALAET